MSSTKLCPVCETENELGAKHCEVCGEPLSIPQAGAAASFDPDDSAAPPSRPSQPEARDYIDAAASWSPDGAPRPAAATLEPTTRGADSLSALDRFDALLAADDDELPSSEPVAAAGFQREQQDTVVDLPAIERPVAVPAPASAQRAQVVTARLVVYQNRQPVHTYEIVTDETLLGRSDPTSDAYPDLDLTPWDEQAQISRKHAYVLREGGRFFVRPLSSAGTQLNRHILDLGHKTELEDGDVIILGGALAMKFHVA